MLKINTDKYKAIIFDMDGTMVDSNPWHKKALEILCKKYGVKFLDEYFNKHIVGRKNVEVFPKIFKNKNKFEINKLSIEKEAIFRKVYKRDIKEVLGLTILINELKAKSVIMAIATTAPYKNVQFFLKSLKLSKKLFKVIVGEEDVKRGKPHPEIFLKVAEKLKVNPGKCLVFEDSKSGIKSAKSAGMKVVAIKTNKMPESIKEADYLVNNFKDIELD